LSDHLTRQSRSAGWAKLRNLENRVFTARNLRFYGPGFAVANITALVLAFFHGNWLFGPDGKLSCIDFGFLWLSGKFAALSDPSVIYDLAKFGAAQTDLFGPTSCVLIHPFEYPPVLLFFTWPIGQMPYFWAFAVWNSVLLALYLAVAYVIVPRAVTIVAALTPFAVARDLQLGHNGLLTAGLIGLPLALLERKPYLAGAVLGLLTYKPQFGLLFPVALLASRNWRALSGAAASSIALAFAAALAFGARTWPSFFVALGVRSPTLSPEPAVTLRLQSVYGLLQWGGAGVPASLAIHFVIALMMAVAVWVVWARPYPHALRASVLCIGCLVVNPYLLEYDFCVLTMAAAFLIRDGLSRGFLPGERAAVVIGWIALIWLHVRVGPVIFCGIMLFVIYRRVAALGADSRALPSTPGSTELDAAQAAAI